MTTQTKRVSRYPSVHLLRFHRPSIQELPQLVQLQHGDEVHTGKGPSDAVGKLISLILGIAILRLSSRQSRCLSLGGSKRAFISWTEDSIFSTNAAVLAGLVIRKHPMQVGGKNDSLKLVARKGSINKNLDSRYMPNPRSISLQRWGIAPMLSGLCAPVQHFAASGESTEFD
jgi:hypothetical protein